MPTAEAICSVCEDPGPHEYEVTPEPSPGRWFTCANPDCWQTPTDEYGQPIEGAERTKTHFWYPPA